MIMARPFRRAAVAETVLAQILASFRLQPLQDPTWRPHSPPCRSAQRMADSSVGNG